jgi:hypothetical protein
MMVNSDPDVQLQCCASTWTAAASAGPAMLQRTVHVCASGDGRLRVWLRLCFIAHTSAAISSRTPLVRQRPQLVVAEAASHLASQQTNLHGALAQVYRGRHRQRDVAVKELCTRGRTAAAIQTEVRHQLH